MPSSGYALVATTVAQLKAITAANRSPNFTLLLPATGSWYYYSPTSTAANDNLTVIQPDDGVGRWLLTSLQAILAAADSAANSAIASHVSANNPHSQYQTASQVSTAASSAASGAVSSHVSASNPHSQYQTASQVSTAAGSAASGAIASHEQASNPHLQYQTSDQVNSAASSAIATHEANSQNPHPQYRRADSVVDSIQPNTTQPAFTAKIASGGSNAGGLQVLTSGGNLAVAVGADGNGRGVITAGAGGLTVGGSPTELLSFYGKTPSVARPNAIALPGNNTTDMRRAINDLINASRATGLLP